MANKKAETKLITILAWVAVIALIAYALNLGGFQGTVNDIIKKDSGSSTSNVDSPTDETTKYCPSTGTTTLTVNTQDELTPTATNVATEVYVFNGNKLVKETSTTATTGTVDVSLTCGKDYKVLVVNTSAGAAAGAYAKIVPFEARTTADTLNVQVTRFGSAKILSIQNPSDLSRRPNVTIGAGATVNFDLQFAANYTNYGYNRPIIMCQVNVTEIQDVNGNSFDDGTSVVEVTSLPKRISATSGFTYYAWEYPKLLTPAMGTKILSGNLVASASTAPAEASSMSCIMVDQATWKTSDYKVAKSIDDGFKTGPENTETNSNVGGPDAVASLYYFYNPDGY